MMSYTVYKVIHYLGVFALVSSLSVSLGRAAAAPAGAGEGGDAPDPWKKPLGIVHGVALLLVILGGFGMLARLGVDHGAIFPGWVWLKLFLWLVLGGLVAFRRSAAWAVRALVLVPLLAALAGFVAFTKPF